MKPNYTTLLGKHLDLFRRERTSKGEPPRPKTIEAHRLQLERLCYKLDQGDLSLTVNDLRKHMIEIDSQTGQANVNQALSAINGFLRFLAGEEIISLEFISKWDMATGNMYRPVKPKGAKERKYFEPRELEEIIFQLSQNTANDIQSNRDTSFFAAILFGPTRLGDLIRATIGNVTFCKEGVIADSKGRPVEVPSHVKIHLTKDQTKDHEERDIFIFTGDTVGGVEILPFFKKYMAWRTTIGNCGQHGPVFTSTRSKKGDFLTPRNMFSRIARHARNAGVKASAHMFRGTWAEINGGNLESREIRQLMGHSADRTSQEYTDQPNDNRLLNARLQASGAISRY